MVLKPLRPDIAASLREADGRPGHGSEVQMVELRVDSLDVRVAETIAAKLLELAPEAPVVDISQVAVIDSAGIGALASVCRSLGQRGERVTLVGCQPQISRVLEETGIATLVDQHNPTADRPRRSTELQRP